MSPASPVIHLDAVRIETFEGRMRYGDARRGSRAVATDAKLGFGLDPGPGRIDAHAGHGPARMRHLTRRSDASQYWEND